MLCFPPEKKNCYENHLCMFISTRLGQRGFVSRLLLCFVLKGLYLSGICLQRYTVVIWNSPLQCTLQSVDVLVECRRLTCDEFSLFWIRSRSSIISFRLYLHSCFMTKSMEIRTKRKVTLYRSALLLRWQACLMPVAKIDTLRRFADTDWLISTRRAYTTCKNCNLKN